MRSAQSNLDRTLYNMHPICLGHESHKAYKVAMVNSARTCTKAYQSPWQGMHRPLSSNFTACMHKDISIISTFIGLPDLLQKSPTLHKHPVLVLQTAACLYASLLLLAAHVICAYCSRALHADWWHDSSTCVMLICR